MSVSTLVGAVAALALSGGGILRSELSPDAPCTAAKTNPVRTAVDLRAVVTPPCGTKLLRVWVPVPPSDDTQTVDASRFETWPMRAEPRIAAEPLYGNRFAYFEFEEPQGAQMIVHRFCVRTHELRWDVDPERIHSVAEWPPAFAPYLRGEEQAVVLSDAVLERARAIVPAPVNAAQDMRSVIGWIEGNLVYDHRRASLRASSEWALETGGGHCSDYHGLCAALGRALGYPTRVTYGINTFPKNSPSHCKAEVFLPPYGWVSFDVSETQKLIGAIERDPELDPAEKAALIEAANRRLFSGFRDNTWFVQTRGTDYDLAPPASRKVAVVRTIWAEADGVPLTDPDPGDAQEREFAWMTLHEFVPDHPVSYPFKDPKSLETELANQEEQR